jgi:predicted MPP superfamily phosphohydrolase
MRRITRRKFLGLGLCALTAVAIDGRLAEPTWLRITHLELYPQPANRFVHISDFHYKGDADYAAKVVATINGLAPQFVCFTGDLVEEPRFAPAAFDFIRQIKRPIYGCPGNWDYESRVDFRDYEKAFAATGGAWLEDRSVVREKEGIEIIGMGLRGEHALGEPQAVRRILLVHYPNHADRLEGRRYDLILAGHSHGGQVRLPFYGALILPYGVGRYDQGRFDSLGGPLYVNVGIGTYKLPVRFNCRPEITVIGI